MEKKRIENLEFRQCSYLGEIPEHPSWEICLWQPNEYYQNEDKFIKDGNYYKYPDETYSFLRIHKDCFKNSETCFQIASFDYDKSEDFYEFHFCGDRPISHKSEYNIKNLWELIEHGDHVLNHYKDEINN